MTNFELIRIWLCECGRVHVETRHCRRSFAPAEFLALARNAAGRNGTEPASRLSKLYQQPAALRASQPLGRLLAKEAA